MSVRSRDEQLGHKIVVRRRLPAPFAHARIYTSPEAGLRYLKPSLQDVDPTLLSIVVETIRPGDIVWDVGANIGLFAFAAAARAGTSGRVLCLEADTWNVTLLRRSAATQPDTSAPVEVLPAAVSDAIGVATFEIAKRNRATNALQGMGSSQTGGVRETQLVPTVTLDFLANHFPLPRVLKIDVEGAEALVLAGADGVLSSHPTIACEVSAKNSDSVRKLLSGKGYVLFDADAPLPRKPLDEGTTFNILAVHAPDS